MNISFKDVCLYVDGLLFGNKLRKKLGIVNEIALQRECQHFILNNVFCSIQIKQRNNNEKKTKDNFCQNRESN